MGDEVTYNNVDYYVIADSGVNEEEVQLLKKDLLTVAQVNQYGAGHVNMYACKSSDSSCYQTAYDLKSDGTVGGMAYYSSATCGYNGSAWVYDGCTTDYAQSEVKYVVDAWKLTKAPAATEARLITVDELVNNLGYESQTQFITGSTYHIKTISTPNWVYSTDYSYWTMTPEDDSQKIWYVLNRDGLVAWYTILQKFTVRPVIVLPKSALSA